MPAKDGPKAVRDNIGASHLGTGVLEERLEVGKTDGERPVVKPALVTDDRSELSSKEKGLGIRRQPERWKNARAP